MKNIFIIAIITILSSSCTHRMTISSKPKPKKLKFSSTKSSSSVYVIPFDASTKGNIVWQDTAGNVRILSEVSPDAIVANVTDLTTKLTGALKSGDSLSAEQITKITQNVSELGKRTVAVSILRDALYRLEEFNMNNSDSIMDTLTYNLFEKILDNAKEIAKAEIASENARKAEAEAEKDKLAFEEKIIESGAKSKFSEATTWEEKGFRFLLDEDLEEAIKAFKKSENIFPTFHSVYEIGRLLKKHKVHNDIKNVFKKIHDNYMIPNKFRNKILEKSK